LSTLPCSFIVPHRVISDMLGLHEGRTGELRLLVHTLVHMVGDHVPLHVVWPQHTHTLVHMVGDHVTLHVVWPQHTHTLVHMVGDHVTLHVVWPQHTHTLWYIW